MKVRHVVLLATATVAALLLATGARRLHYARSFYYSRADGVRTPFGNNGRPWSIPGRLEAEHYDLGTADDPSYRDATEGSAAPVDQRFREDDVDLGVDPLLSLVDVGWTYRDEWLEYTIDATVSGDYTLTTRVATPWEGQWFHLELDGDDLTGPIYAPKTGCWGSDLKGSHCFDTVTTTGLHILQGPHRLRFVCDTGNYTIDWFDLKLEALDAQNEREDLR